MNHALIRNELAAKQRPLRLTVVTETFPPEVNGVAMTIGRMVDAMRARDHQVQLIRPRQNPQDLGAPQTNLEQVLKPGIPIPYYQSLRMGLPVYASLLRAWRERRPDIVHVVTEGPLGWSALSAALKLGIPVTSAFHTNFHSYSRHYGLGWLTAPIARYLRKFHNRTQLTLVPTASLRDELTADGYQRVQVISRGVDTNLFNPSKRSNALRAAWGAAPDDVVVIYVGRIAPEKNLSLVRRAFSALRTRFPNAKLVLVGDGPLRRELAHSIPDAISCGTRVGEELATHYASADVFLFPSLTETFGNVTLEAMASGLAVVAYDYAAAHELIHHGHDGLLVPFDDEEEFQREARQNLVDRTRIRMLGDAARRVAETMDWESIHTQFEHVLSEIATHHGAHNNANQLEFNAGPA